MKIKSTLRHALQGIFAAAFIVIFAAVTWWDAGDAESGARTSLLSGTKTPGAEQVPIEDVEAHLTCPSQPVLASLGDEEDEDEGEAPVGTFDPDYAPTTGDAESFINAFNSTPEGEKSSQSSITEISEADTTHKTHEFSRSKTLQTIRSDVENPAVLTASEMSGETVTRLAGLRFGNASEGDLRGLAASPCLAVEAEHWLIGGETEPGSSAKLELVNPGDTPATARIDLWGSVGELDPVGSQSVLVPAGERKHVLLEGLVPGESRIAAHVTASGGRIGAAIQDTRTQGLTPGGVDYVTPSAPPAKTQAIPGMVLEDGAAGLRILSPRDEPTNITVHLVTPSGKVEVADLEDREIPGGVVADIPLTGVTDGTYSVVVESDDPVVASGYVDREGEDDRDPNDIGWMPSVPGEKEHLMTLPQEVEDIGFSVNVGALEDDAVAQVRLVTTDGVEDAEQLFLKPRESRTVSIKSKIDDEDVIGVLVEADEPVAAGMAITRDLEPQTIALLPGISPAALDNEATLLFEQ